MRTASEGGSNGNCESSMTMEAGQGKGVEARKRKKGLEAETLQE